MTHKMTMAVLPNEIIGVRGGYEVNMIFTVSGHCGEFVAKLPKEIQREIHKDSKEKESFLTSKGLTEKNLHNFPYIGVGALKYSPELVGLLSQLASYSLREHADDILSLLQE